MAATDASQTHPQMIVGAVRRDLGDNSKVLHVFSTRVPRGDGIRLVTSDGGQDKYSLTAKLPPEKV